jgi:hypothetical protein
VKVWNADPWPDPNGVLAESEALGFSPEPTAVIVAGTRWFTVASLPVAVANLGGRMFLVGASNAALFSTD